MLKLRCWWAHKHGQPYLAECAGKAVWLKKCGVCGKVERDFDREQADREVLACTIKFSRIGRRDDRSSASVRSS